MTWSRKDKVWESTEIPAMTTADLAAMEGSAASKAKDQLMFFHCSDGDLHAVKQLVETQQVGMHITMRPGVTPLHIAVDIRSRASEPAGRTETARSGSWWP